MGKGLINTGLELDILQCFLFVYRSLLPSLFTCPPLSHLWTPLHSFLVVKEHELEYRALHPSSHLITSVMYSLQYLK